jgi:hypothetical protein
MLQIIESSLSVPGNKALIISSPVRNLLALSTEPTAVDNTNADDVLFTHMKYWKLVAKKKYIICHRLSTKRNVPGRNL